MNYAFETYVLAHDFQEFPADTAPTSPPPPPSNHQTCLPAITQVGKQTGHKRMEATHIA